ncbi:MAG TPA: PRC-barrel domain-containing protein [Candidatus Magasanikbacteria bacterium]|nr:PRC-barrel domain-containing protein [Candidatus Magasanikbacteria bacterium]
MKLACSKLLKMHVYTTSGKHVGRVKDISFDLDSGLLREYLVSSLLHRTYTIAREQVVRYEEDKMFVEDRVLEEFEKSGITMPIQPPNPVGLVEDEARA